MNRRGEPLRPIRPSPLDHRGPYLGCWEWTGNRQRGGAGHGQVRVEGKLWLVSRLAYHLIFGPIPEGLHVCHRCDNPPCWNPAHLFLGTRADNMRDMAAKARGNTVKLSARQVREIRARYSAGGITQRALAEEYGVGQQPIWCIVNGQSWKDA